MKPLGFQFFIPWITDFSVSEEIESEHLHFRFLLDLLPCFQGHPLEHTWYHFWSYQINFPGRIQHCPAWQWRELELWLVGRGGLQWQRLPWRAQSQWWEPSCLLIASESLELLLRRGSWSISVSMMLTFCSCFYIYSWSCMIWYVQLLIQYDNNVIRPNTV